MKTIVVPDIHGRTFWKSVLDYFDSKIIFLGDYLDPYPNENINHKETINNFKDILSFKEKNIDRVILLIGNHDASYIFNDLCSCRHDRTNHKLIHDLFETNKEFFNIYYKEDDVLFTHAGVLDDWYNSIKDINAYSDIEFALEDLWKTNPSLYLDWISIFRGGYSKYGSPIWADLREHALNTPFNKDSIFQIFGHTQLTETGSIYRKENFICCDSRACFELNKHTLTRI